MSQEPASAPFAELLHRFRLVAGLTQEELAVHAGLSPRGLVYLERGTRQPHRETVRRLAEALGLTGEARAWFESAGNKLLEPAAAEPGPPQASPVAESAPPLPTGMLIVMIADVRGYTAYTHRQGDVAGARLATRFATLADEAVHGQGGRVVEVRGDEVMAVFTSAHGALRAARDLLACCASEASEELPLRAGVGLDVGEPVRVPGGYRGEVLNVAARLCAQAGPGEVLASEAVVSLARRVEGLNYEERGELTLKGLSRPVRAWLVRADDAVAAVADGTGAAATGADGTAPPAASPLPRGRYLGAAPDNALVGREVELDRLRAALDATRGGQGRLVLLAGEPGVGKTRLAQELMLLARDAACLLLVGRCFEEHGGTPYFPFLGALAAAWEAASPALRRLASQHFAALGRLLPEVLPVPPLQEVDEARLRVLRAVEGFVLALAAERPLVLLLDDLHWADHASLDLLRHLARALASAPVLLVGTYRDVEVGRQHPLGAALAHLRRERLAEVVAVRALPPDGTAALIRAQFGVTDVSAELRDMIHARTEGNPFFTEEVLAALVEQGAIYREGDAWQRKEMAELLVPESVRAVVGQRVGRLPEPVQELLQLASVLGQEFDLPVLVAATGQEEGAVLDGVEAALAARLLEERRVGRTERYAFSHALVAQTLYDEVPRFRLRRLHLRAAKALALARGEQPDTAAELAHHYLAGGDEERAARYAEAAGDHAAQLYAHEEATGHYRMAVALRDDREERVPAALAHRKLGLEYVALLRKEEAFDALHAALAGMEAAGDTPGQALVQQALAQAHIAWGEQAAAEEHLARAEALWPAERADSHLVDLWLQIAGVRSFGGDHRAAASYAERAAALAERLGDPALQVRALYRRATSAMLQSAPPIPTIPMFDRAEALARRAGDWDVLASITNNRATVRWYAGDPRGALADYSATAEAAERAGSPRGQLFGLDNARQVLEELGDWKTARAMLDRAEALDPDAVRYGELYTFWRSGRWQEYVAALQQPLDDARRRGHLSDVLILMMVRADVRLQLGDVLAAVDEAREGYHPAATRDLGGFTQRTGAILVEALALAGTLDAGAVGDEVEAATARSGYAWGMPRLLRARGLLQAQRGDHPGALATLRESAEVARARGAQVDRARTLLALADVARVANEDQTAQAADAERLAVVIQIGPETAGLTWARGVWE